MTISFSSSYDDKKKATIYTLKKTVGKDVALAKIVDSDNNGMTDNDGIIFEGKTSILNNDDVDKHIFSQYRNTGATTNLPKVEYTSVDGKADMKTGKVYSLGSFANLLKGTPPTSNSQTSPITTNFPNFTGSNYMDTSWADGMGTNPTTTGQMDFNAPKFADYQRMYDGIGAVLGMATAMGEHGSEMIQYLMPSMLPQSTNFFSTTFNRQNTPETPEVVAAGPAGTGTGSQSTVTNPNAAVTLGSDLVADTHNEFVRFKKENDKENKIDTAKLADGTTRDKWTDKNGDRIIDISKDGKLISRDRYDKKKNEHRSEIFEGDKKGTIIKVYTNKEGQRVAVQWKRESANKLSFVKKTVLVADQKTPAQAREKDADTKIKDLNTQLAVAQKEKNNATGNARIAADKKVWEIKGKIADQNSVKTSPELKKLYAELKTETGKCNNAKTEEEGETAAILVANIEHKITTLEEKLATATGAQRDVEKILKFQRNAVL